MTKITKRILVILAILLTLELVFAIGREYAFEHSPEGDPRWGHIA